MIKLEREIPEEDKEIDKMEFYLIMFIVMVFFFVMAAINEKYKPRCGH